MTGIKNSPLDIKMSSDNSQLLQLAAQVGSQLLSGRQQQPPYYGSYPPQPPYYGSYPPQPPYGYNDYSEMTDAEVENLLHQRGILPSPLGRRDWIRQLRDADRGYVRPYEQKPYGILGTLRR